MQRMFYSTTTAIAAMLVIFQLPLLAQAHKGNRKIEQQGATSGQQSYRDFWPKTISVTLTYRDGRRKVVQIKGAEYWNTLSASTRMRLNTFNKLYCYCQFHEGGRGY